jgi:hypothetical protein
MPPARTYDGGWDRGHADVSGRRRPLPVQGALVGFEPMVLALSKAASMDIGLIATFGGIGVIVNVILVMIAIQVRGERRANREYRERLLQR